VHADAHAERRMKPAKLDVRRSRKLTSRECSSIIGGYVGGMTTSDLVGVAVARAAVGLYVEGDVAEVIWSRFRHQADRGSGATADAVEESRQWQADGADEAHRIFWRGLGSVISGCRVLASERSVRTAIRWIYEQDEFWPKALAEKATATDLASAVVDTELHPSSPGLRQPPPKQGNGDVVEPGA
jgi:hypothetical protein